MGKDIIFDAFSNMGDMIKTSGKGFSGWITGSFGK